MNKKKSMYVFMICFTVGSIILLVDGYNYYIEQSVLDTSFCGCVNDELKPYLCPVRFTPFSSFAISNYFYFFGVIGLMFYKNVPSLTDICLLIKDKYSKRQKKNN